MAKQKKTDVIKMNGYVTWAKLTPATIDDAEYHEKTEGQYNCNFYFAEESDLKKYLDAGGPTESMGHQMVKEDPEAPVGIGKFIKLKRPNVHPSVPAFGGAPRLFDWREEPGTTKKLDPSTAIGNWSEATAKVTIYGEGSTAVVRLEALAFTDIVDFEGDGVFENPDVF